MVNNGDLILIGGGNSLIGKGLLLKLLNEGVVERGYLFYLTSRPSSLKSLREYTTKLEELYPEFKGKYHISPIEITSSGWGLSLEERELLYKKVTYMIHLAAVRSNGPYSYEINTRGMETSLAIARRCKNLKRFIYVSSVFVNGDYKGKFYEDWLDIGQNFSDQLSRSFFIAEKYLRPLFNILPFTVLRVGFLINDIIEPQLQFKPCCDEELRLFIKAIKKMAPFFSKTDLKLPIDGLTNSIIPITPLSFLVDTISYFILKNVPINSSITFCIIDPAKTTLDNFVEKIISLSTGNNKRTTVTVAVPPYLKPIFHNLASLTGSILNLTGKQSKLLKLITQRQSFDIYNTLKLIHMANLTLKPIDEYLRELITQI